MIKKDLNSEVNIIMLQANKLGYMFLRDFRHVESTSDVVYSFKFKGKNNELYTYKEMQKIILKNKINNL